jgi:threonine dehydratase
VTAVSVKQVPKPFIDVDAAIKRLKGVVNQTPLLPNLTYSNLLGADILLKRED